MEEQVNTAWIRWKEHGVIWRARAFKMNKVRERERKREREREREREEERD